jgi:alpha-galactosidase
MDYAHLQGGNVSMVLHVAPGHVPRFIYWGARLTDDADLAALDKLGQRSGVDGGPDIALPCSLAMESGLGLFAPPMLSAHRNGRDSLQLFLTEKSEIAAQSITIACRDVVREMMLIHDIALDVETGIMSASSTLINQGQGALMLDAMASLCLPVSAGMQDIIGFHGRWAQEFQMRRFARPPGSWLSENMTGRTSHSHFPGVILCEGTCNEQQGRAYGVHLGWSGNHSLRVDSLADGRVQIAGSAKLLAGEINLAAEERYQTPTVYAGFSDQGLSRLSQNFQTYVQANILPRRFADTPRPVHYNCWEAIYFHHDIDVLKALASKAAAVGVERFVLDDGWFGARRNDRAGLGDWHVSRDIYPDGLHPLIAHIKALGMEMGLWFEPEMVNPDSDLYRTHPDWVLGLQGAEQIPFRSQYVLDISRKEVSDYLFGQMDALLREYPIDYIKWDMNRDISHPVNAEGRAAGNAYVTALYALIDRVRAAHPNVEIESCSSGGGRIDYGILQRTDRVWTSDSNDALDRQIIQRGASHWLPLRISGSHIGPRICKITQREIPMAMRAASAIFGHMGLELDLLSEPQEQLDELARAIALYKAHRGLIHGGDFYRLAERADGNDVMIVAADKNNALLSIAQLHSAPNTLPMPLRLTGLDPIKIYRLSVIWPDEIKDRHAQHYAQQLEALSNKGVTGAMLMQHGVPPAQMQPGTALILHLQIAG